MKNRSSTRRNCHLIFDFWLTLLIIVVSTLDFNSLKAQPIIESTSTNADQDDPITVNAPSGITNGDLLIAGIMLEKGNKVTVTATGWTSILATNDGDQNGIRTYYKIANSEPGSYSFGINESGKWSVGIVLTPIIKPLTANT